MRSKVRITMSEPILFCWSGGKDSAMALHALRQDNVPIAALLTTVTETYDRISMHGVRRELLLRQAESIGLPLHEVRIPPQCINPIYEARMEEALRVHYDAGVRTVASCVDPKVLDPSFAGRELDASFFRDLPAGVDPCGENGEFHTFVFDGPIFRNPIPVRVGEIVERDSFIYCDLLPPGVVGAQPACCRQAPAASPWPSTWRRISAQGRSTLRPKRPGRICKSGMLPL